MMRTISLILLMLAAGETLAASACGEMDDEVAALRCSYVQFADSTAALSAAENATLDVMKAWQTDPFAEQTIERFRASSLQFIVYRDAECEFQSSIRRVFENADVIERLRLDCQVALNSQRIDMLKKLFPPLPPI